MPAALILADVVDPSKVQSSLVCQVFPFLKNIGFFGIDALCGGQSLTAETAATKIAGLVQTVVSFIFVAIVIIAVYIIIRAAIKYIRSEGDETKIQEAQKAIKSVFIGLVALFIGVIGLVLILVIFNALGAVQNDTGKNPINDLQSTPL